MENPLVDRMALPKGNNRFFKLPPVFRRKRQRVPFPRAESLEFVGKPSRLNLGKNLSGTSLNRRRPDDQFIFMDSDWHCLKKLL